MLTDYLQRNSSDYEAVNLLIQCYYDTERYEQAAQIANSLTNKYPCFRNNYLISSFLAGNPSGLASINLTAELNPFVTYNAQILEEEGESWEPSRGVSVKSKLMFQEFRFGNQDAEKKDNILSVRTRKKPIEFKKKIISIGRLEKNDLVLKKIKISRRHCVVINYLNDVWIYDLQSTYGTFVADLKVQRKQFLLGVYAVRLGNQSFQIASKHDLLL